MWTLKIKQLEYQSHRDKKSPPMISSLGGLYSFSFFLIALFVLRCCLPDFNPVRGRHIHSVALLHIKRIKELLEIGQYTVGPQVARAVLVELG